ncbi:hypothetical protein [Cohnella terricola]|uniref:Uncharacterized protein n=1 Tax=Cohnella terricola TaxID=1289167 RepID=A0A559JMR6_9BACL|nr:hypothetical protein [Cohnella terricola]TVY01169.1 hypothetical protein FPZ45_08425 [Cohnella terricola]
MKDRKPDWYERLKNGPFREDAFGSDQQREVEVRAQSGGKLKRRRRLNGKAAALMAACLIVALVAIAALSQPFSSDRQASVGGGSEEEQMMTGQFAMDHLQVGMSQEEVLQLYGDDNEGQSVNRDFQQGHKEDPNDMSTWNAVDLWRYDYGVRNGYQVKRGDGTQDPEGGFDLYGIRNGEIQSQLIIYWRDRKLERAIVKMNAGDGAIGTMQIGPAVAEAPPTDPPPADDPPAEPDLPIPNEGVRAVGDASSGQFQLRPRKDGEEKIQMLGAPSCLGQETDVQLLGDYDLFLVRPSGEETLVQRFEQLEMIRRGNDAAEFTKLDFPNIEMFLFFPRYTDCHGLEFYAYGIDKVTGEASNYTFRDGETDFPNWVTSTVDLPRASEGKLIVEGGRWAGQDNATRSIFVPDSGKHEWVLESEERIP